MTSLNETTTHSLARPLSHKTSKHLPALDGLRGLAIVLVLYHHFIYDADLFKGPWKLLYFGAQASWVGVDLFFVLSGFLITGILYDSRKSPRYFRNFYARRTLRIFPLYYGVLLLCYVLLPQISTLCETMVREVGTNQRWLWLYGTNFLIATRGVFPNLMGMGPYWSLAVEEHFYLIWPLIVLWCNRRKGIQVCIACIVFAALLRTTLILLGVNNLVNYVLTPCRFDSLAAGGFVAFLIRGQWNITLVRRRAKWTFMFCLLGLGGITIWRRGLHYAEPSMQIIGFPLLMGLFASVLIISLSPGPMLQRVLESRTLGFFGTYSYGMYMFHLVFQNVLERYTSPMDLALRFHSNLLGVAIFGGICFVTTVLIALISYHCYEKPFLGLKRYFEDRTLPIERKEGDRL